MSLGYRPTKCLLSAILSKRPCESAQQQSGNKWLRFGGTECQTGRCATTTVTALPPGQMPTEDVPPEQEKHVHDFRTRRVQGGIFGSGICSTGSFGLPSLVERVTSPDQVYKPRKLDWLDTKKIRRVAAGFGFSLFASHKELYGAGLNNFYQIGGPMRTNKKHGRSDHEAKQWYIRGRRITLPEDAGSIRNIAAGRLHAIVATENMYLALGDNSHGQCGLDPEKVGVSASDLEYNWPRISPTWDCKERENQVRQVHCCLDTTFILLRSGAIYAFGLGTDGQLGNGNLNFQWEPRLVEGDLKGVKISKIAGNTDTLMAVSTEGDLFMWGQNEYGQLSMISDEPQVYFPRHVPLKLGKLVDVAATGSSCLVLNSEGEVYTWGSQILGLGPKIEYLSSPMRLDPPLFACAVGDEGRIKKIYGGNTMFGAVNEGGHIFTWGPNTNGNLGVGHPNHQFFPYQVFLPETIADKNEAVSFGPDHSVFLLYFGKMGYLQSKDTGDFTLSSFWKGILDISILSLQIVFGEGCIRQHANDRFKLVSMLCQSGFASVVFFVWLQPSSILFILLWYSGFSILTFVIYYMDQNYFSAYRNLLHCLEFVGGWPGAWVAQKLLRHEIHEPGYQSVFEVLVMVNVNLLLACALLFNLERIIKTVVFAVATVVVAINYIPVLFDKIAQSAEPCERILQHIANIVFLLRFLKFCFDTFVALYRIVV
ncbi:regulator of chromosome condensation (RCC1) repeat domain-containing protein [Ditylenchus destructor]|nr:regulator of chromosome condensation (RCC1) repeat domain-containing protein [Ditylenchus destructor]